MKKINLIVILCMASMMLACGNKTQSALPVADTSAVDSIADTTAVAEVQSAAVSPEKMITDIINEMYSKEHGMSYDDVINKYGSASFKKALKVYNASVPEGELGSIDYDFFIQGQDWDDSLSAKVISVTVKDDRAEAKVKIHNGENNIIRLTFVKERLKGNDTYCLDDVIDKCSDIKHLMLSE